MGQTDVNRPSTTGLCELCGKQRHLVDSHIIPKSFYDLPKEGDVLRIHSSKPDLHPRRAPKGIYNQILCEECEARLAPWDDYAFRFLSVDPSTLEAHQADNDTWIEVRPSVNYEKLKLFAISVLWRAHVSQHETFRTIQLGPYAEKAKKLIEASDPGVERDFATFFLSFDETYAPHMLGPQRISVGPVNFYKFHLARHVMYVKVDSRSVPWGLDELELRPDDRLLVLRTRFEGSMHHQSVLKHFKLKPRSAYRKRNSGLLMNTRSD